MDNTDMKYMSDVCRVCLEKSSKMYPLEGPALNSEVDVSTMISYCTSLEVELCDDLPKSVCTICYRTICIAYKFIESYNTNNLINKENMSNVCRMCLEESSKMYPLVGPILNVDVEVATMISYCTFNEVLLSESLPKGVCVTCFRNLRITYNFIYQFNESNEKLLKLRKTIIPTTDFEQESDVTDIFKEEIILSEGLMQKEIDYEEKFNDVENEDVDIFHSTSSNTVEIMENFENDEIESRNCEDYRPLRKKATIKIYSCPICPRKATKFDSVFVPHLYTHKYELLKCTLCSSAPEMNVDDYLQHYKKLHLYQCHICKKSFSRKSSQYYHMKVHNENKLYTCSYENCTKAFLTPWSLKKHLNIHSESVMYICSKCGKKFNTYDTFRYHQKTHDGRRNHLCPECGRAFLQAVHLKYHMWKHTGIKRFRCDKCEKSYTSVTQLKKHLRKYCGQDNIESVRT